jgi:hypothetical protein
MKKILCSFLLLSLVSLVFGASPDGINPSGVALKWGQYEKMGKKLYGKEIVHENDNFVYVIEKENKNTNLLFFEISKPYGLILTVYKSDGLTIVNSSSLSFPKSEVKYEYSILKLDEIGSKLYLFITAHHPKTDEVKLLVQELADNGQQLGSIYEVDTGIATKSAGLFKKKKLTSFSVQLSPEGTKIGIVKFNSVKEDEHLSVGYKMLDENLKTLWSGSLELPYKHQFFDLTSYEIGNDGQLFLLGKAWKLERKVGQSGKSKTKISKQKKGSPNYSYKCLIFTMKSKTLKQLDVGIMGSYVTDVAMRYRPGKDQLYLAGFFSEQWGSSIRGTFNKTIDVGQAKVVQSKQKKFNQQFLKLFLSNKQIKKLDGGKKGNYELANFRLDNLTIKQDGSVLVVAEMYYVKMNTSSIVEADGFISTRTNYTYHYGDIIAIYLNTDGEVRWTAKIPKHQVSYNDGGPFSSYIINVENDKLYLVFNDNRSNIQSLKEGKGIQKMGSPKNSVTVVVTIDNHGVMTREQLFSAKESEVVFRPKSSWYERGTHKSSRIYLFGLNYKLFSRVKFKLGSMNFPQKTVLGQ